MRLAWIAVVVALSATAAAQEPAPPSPPDPQPRADEAFREGSRLYDARDYAGAATQFEAAYAQVADPAFLFNIGQAYRLADQCEKAAAAYQRYIELAPAAPNLDDARRYLKQSNVCALFADGRRLMGLGKPGEACVKFAAALEGDPGAVGTMLNLGLCNEQSGKLATALGWYRRAKKQAVNDRSQESEQAATLRISALEPRVPRIAVELTGAKPGVVVEIDGNAVPATDLGRVDVDPGSHVVEVRGPGIAAQRKQLALLAGQRQVVSFAFIGESTAPRSRRPLAYITGGVGLGLLAGTAVLGVVGKDRYDTTTSREVQQTWKTRVRYGGGAMFVLGTAAVTTSIILFVREPRERRRTVVAPSVNGGELGIAISGSF